MQEQLYNDIYNIELTYWWSRARRHIIRSLLERYTPAERPLQLADVGCGMGANFLVLKKFGWVVGVDFSPTALTYSRARGERVLVAAGLPHLPFPDNAFDVVTALDVIEHIDDDHAAVRELWRVCKPGGLLVLTVPAYQWLYSDYDEINEHKRRYSRPRLRACVAQQGGCEFLKLSYMCTVLALPVMAVRLVKNLLRVARSIKHKPTTDIFLLPGPLNRILEILFASEAIWLRFGRLPFGTSVVCVARKAEAGCV